MAGQKTEKPTPHRLQKARKDGRFPSSKDLLSAIQFALALVIGLGAGQEAFSSFEQLTVDLIHRAFSSADLTSTNVPDLFRDHLWPPIKMFLNKGFIIAGISLFIHLGTTGFGIATKQLMPDFKKLNFISHLTQLPQQNIPALLKSAVLIPVIALVVYAEISGRLGQLANLSVTGFIGGLTQARDMITGLLWRLTFALLILGFIDFARQRQRFNKEMRMTKQEIRDEMKEMEGNPQMKMRIRRLQRDAARRSMMKSLPSATAIIVNPTHYAVALKYEMNSKSVPTIVAKGKNYLALQIRKKAMEYDIPIIEDKPLAQALYAAGDVGQEIPPNLYRAVAEVLAHIYRTLDRR